MNKLFFQVIININKSLKISFIIIRVWLSEKKNYIKMIRTIKEVLNYIIGSEEMNSDAARSINQNQHSKGLLRKIKGAIALNLKYFSINVGFMFPFFSVATVIFILLLVIMIGTEFVVYQVGMLSGKFLEVLSDKNLSGFRDVAILAVVLIVVNATMKALRDYLANLLAIVWRKHLTLRIHEMYFEDKRFYYLHNPLVLLANLRGARTDAAADSTASTRLQVSEKERPVAINNRRPNSNTNLVNSPAINSSTAAILSQSVNSTSAAEHLSSSFEEKDTRIANLDNPDQRITQDVNSLCNSLSTIVPVILITPFLIGWYGYKVKFLLPQKCLYLKIVNFKIHRPIVWLVFRARCRYLSTFSSGVL